MRPSTGHRRHIHVGVINQQMWSAHDRRSAGSNGDPGL